MVQVKLYNCPGCNTEITTRDIRANGKRCPSCKSPLKHVISKIAGAMAHNWIVDPEREVVLDEEMSAMPAVDKFRRIYRPYDNPELYEAIVNRPSEINHIVVYKGRFGDTDLHCPSCGAYLHTTNIIYGGRQTVYCRTAVKSGESWGKCKNRTEFIFKKFGEGFNANNY